MKNYILALIFSFLLTFLSCKIFIPFLRKLKIGQPIYKYVDMHKGKEGTPTMGGLLFVIPVCIISLLFMEKDGVSFFVLAIGFAYMLVGFIDDFIKIRYKDNQGLKPYQKIIFQFSIAILSGYYCYKNGLTYLIIPFSKNYVDIGVFSIILNALIFIAITNSVNLTDGIDGLSSTVSLTYISFFIVLLLLEDYNFSSIYIPKGFFAISFSIIGALVSFLIFNVNKASVFMGDTGSLSLGGFIGALSIFSSNSLFIPILGIMFVFSSISVILQVLYFKRTKKRIFLMAPFHHHLQMKGLSEGKICYVYFLVTFLMGTFLVFAYL